MYKVHLCKYEKFKVRSLQVCLIPAYTCTCVIWIIVHVSRYKKINDENQHLSPMKTSEECRNVLTTWCVGINEILVCFIAMKHILSSTSEV